MIPQAYLTEWRSRVAWNTAVQVEQDLIICRAMVELFMRELLAEHLVFRGGTALHKLHLAPAMRYSEDIDLVQIKSGPNRSIIEAVRQALDKFLGKPQWDIKERGTTILYRVESEIAPVMRLRLKVEINTREHFAVLGVEKHPFVVESQWFTGKCDVPTYSLTELLGTKLRALYQRNKGRDLFDLWHGITVGKAQPAVIVDTFRKYMKADGYTVSQKEFRNNLALKLTNAKFLGDTVDLLHTSVAYDQQHAHDFVDQQVLALL
ncbi:MAG: nucleotidyl transferase AbiEii/AbiGii toxin family protein [Verrucomicrobia bacterium]|nr:nucleotidyl transferase AbiEii/AbiGii toxin family protein [Verrucomicrobiota bacterium]